MDQNLELDSQGGSKKAFPWIIIIIIVFVIVVVGLFVAKKLTKPLPMPDPGKDFTLKQEKETADLKTLENLSFDQTAEATDPFNDQNGPFFHKVYKATSKDGIAFTKTGELIADKSSVPDVVKMADGKLFVYAVDGAKRSTQGLMVSVSVDNGKTWKSGSFSIEATSSEAFVPADPQAVLLEDGSIRLFFVAFPTKKPALDSTGKPIPSGEKYKIKSAVSTDGLNFKEEEGVRYESTDILTDPDVVKIGEKWFMYLAKGSEQIAASSSDGLTFKLEKTVRMDGAISKTVKADDGSYRQFYCKNGISSSKTTDGLSFSDEKVALADSPGEIICDPSPVKVGSEWLLFYKAAPVPAN